MIHIFLPAYNEEKGLAALLSRLPAVMAFSTEPWRVVVVDDGSRDRTAEVATSFRDRFDVHLIRFDRNRGVGDAFREGLRSICASSPTPERDICITLDSDNTQDPEKIPAMVEKIRSGTDIVIASRFRRGGGMIGCPWKRVLFSNAVSLFMRTLTRLPGVRDFSTFYRAFRVSILIEAFDRYGDRLLSGKGFAAAGGLLLKTAALTSHISEVPSVLRFELKSGRSGIKISRTVRGYLELMLDYVLTRGYRKF
ncbi:MAG: glycosyltransferase family 2 protein [Acidobacteriota bacterium]|nr:glycosyltransferase family 2 protein [Acidobacteriota bacterium]